VAVEVRWEDIRVLSTEEVTIYPEPAKAVRVLAVTYTYRDYPPRTVWIDRAKYTRENLLRLIREDIARVVRGPELPPY